MRLALGRGVGIVLSRPSLERTTSRGHSRLSSGGATSSRDAMIPVILLLVPYLTFLPSVARSVDGAPRVSPAVDGVA
jgi:hypothetical protein